MSNNTKKLAKSAVFEEDIKRNFVYTSSRIVLARYGSLLRHHSNEYVVAFDDRLDNYPPNQTDQTHALSISQQIRRGQIDGTLIDDSEVQKVMPGESVLPFYNREELSMQEHDFKQRVAKEYQAQKRRQEAEISAAKARDDKSSTNQKESSVSDSEASEEV